MTTVGLTTVGMTTVGMTTVGFHKLYVPTSIVPLFIAIKTEATEKCYGQPRSYLTFYRSVALATKLIFQALLNSRISKTLD